MGLAIAGEASKPKCVFHHNLILISHSLKCCIIFRWFENNIHVIFYAYAWFICLPWPTYLALTSSSQVSYWSPARVGNVTDQKLIMTQPMRMRTKYTSVQPSSSKILVRLTSPKFADWFWCSGKEVTVLLRKVELTIRICSSAGANFNMSKRINTLEQNP